MPWCPKCKVEYQEGFTVCSDCRHELVEQAEVPEGGESDEEAPVPEEWAFLINFEDDREVIFIESLLRSFGIPMLRKYRGLGGYFKILTGMSTFGVDLFVPESQLETAREILESTPEL